MKVLPGTKFEERILEFENQQEFESFFDDAEQNGEFFLPADDLPANVVLRAIALGSPRSRKIRPVSITKDGNGFRIQLQIRNPSSSTSADPVLPQQMEIPPAEPLPADTPAEETDSQPVAESAEPSTSGEFQLSLRDRIRALSVTDRAALAMKADFQERRVLMQENNPKIHEFLLRNPRITDREIAFIAGNPSSPMSIILSIAGHRDWMSNESIRGGIITNPKTPAAFLMEKIPYLSAADLIKMHHARNLREDIRECVKRYIKKRGIHIKTSAD